MAYGLAGHIGVAKETTYGTPVAVASGDFVEALSETLTLERERFDTRNIIARFTEPDDQAGLRRIEGDIVVPGHPISIGHFLNGVFGQGSRTITTVLSGFLWTTEWWPAPSDFSSTAPLPPYTLEIFRDVTSSNRYAGGQFGRHAVSVQPNQDARFTVGVIAKTTSVVAKSTATFPGSPTDVFAFDTASVSIGGAGTDLVEALSITTDAQLEGVPVLNSSDEVARVRRRGFFIVRTAGTLSFENLAEYNDFINQTERRITLSLFRANSFQLTYDMPRAVISRFPVNIGGRERLTVPIEWIARHHVGSGTPIAVRLTTVRSNY